MGIIACKSFQLQAGHKNIITSLRVVFVARDRPYGSYLFLYQILSKHFKPLESKGVHKKLTTFKGDNLKRTKQEFSIHRM